MYLYKKQKLSFFYVFIVRMMPLTYLCKKVDEAVSDYIFISNAELLLRHYSSTLLRYVKQQVLENYFIVFLLQ